MEEGFNVSDFKTEIAAFADAIGFKDTGFTPRSDGIRMHMK